MSRNKAKAEPREIYSFRLGREEKEKLFSKARYYGLSPSEYLRAVAVSGKSYDPTLGEDRKKLLGEVSRIGNNINQIARWANTNQQITKEQVEDVWDELFSIHNLINRMTEK